MEKFQERVGKYSFIDVTLGNWYLKMWKTVELELQNCYDSVRLEGKFNHRTPERVILARENSMNEKTAYEYRQGK